MNRHFYRIVFNKARGMLMVVGEFGTSAHGTPTLFSGPVPRSPVLVSKLSTLQFALLVSLGLVSLASTAGVVADDQAAGNQQPTIIRSANGTPQINIQTPSSGGVSRNVYSQFDVDNKGVVLNNSHSSTQTQLAGMVNGNDNLARGEAKVILNEVNARHASQLNGMIEVAGQKAQVVIANPSGITCNGCGFINAHRATLTTGQVQMNNGLITGYDANNGEIVIQGAGMDSSRQDSTDLIARAVKVNAGIWARKLNATAGRNTVDAEHQVVTAKAADGSTAPALAIDVASLGGMYANKIRLFGTENGVGVHNAGNIGASAGDVVVNANGTIGNTGSINASQNLHLTSQQQVDNSGKIYAAGNTTITAGGMLNNNGIIAASHNTTLNAASVASNSTAALAAGMNSDGTLGSTGNLTVTSQGELKINSQASAAGELTATGTVLDFSGSQTFGNNISLQATTGSISTQQATLSATQQLTVSARDTINNDGGKISADDLSLTARSLSSQQGLIQQLSTRDLQLFLRDGLNNTGGSLLTRGRLTLSGGQMVLDDATVQARQVTITADSLSHRHGNTLQTGSGDLSVTVNGLLDNQQGRIAANGTLLLKAESLNNQQGQLIAAQNGALQIETQAHLNNQQGVITAAGDLSLGSTGLNNSGGLLQSGSDMTLALADGDLINRDSGGNGGIFSHNTLTVEGGNIDNTTGFITSGGDASLTGLNLTNQRGTLASDAGLTLTTNTLNNQSGRVQAGTNLDLNTRGNTLTNTGGVFNAGKTLTLLTGALLNSSGQLTSAGALQLNTQGKQLDNTSGTIAASGDAQLNTGTLSNIGGQIQIAGNALLNAGGTGLDNTSGLIRGGTSLSLTTAQLINRNTRSENTGIEGQSVTLSSDALDNSDGAIRANDLLDITVASSLNNSGALISSTSLLNFNGGNSLAFTNTAGTLIGGSAVNLTAYSLSGDGRILSQNTMKLLLQQAFFNQGDVIANGDMNFTTGNGLVNQSLIKAGGVLNLQAGGLENQQWAEISAGENHLLLTGDLINRGLLDGGLMHIVASNLTNTGTGRLYGDHIALQTGTLNNLAEKSIAATVAARDRLDIGAAAINNLDHGLIYSAGDIAIGGILDGSWRASGKSSVFNNHSATLESAGDMTLNIREINNINDHLVTEVVVVEQSSHHEAVLSGSTTRYNWDDVDTSTSNKYGVHAAIMPDGSSGRTFYEYQYDRTITETQVIESDPGQIMAGGSLTINSDRVNNHDSRIVAGGLLGGIIGELNNIATTGERVIADIGTQIRWYAKKSGGGGVGGTKTSQGKDSDTYSPDDIIQTIDLQTIAWQGNEAISGSGTTIAGRDTSGTDTTIIHAGDITADTGQTPLTPPSGQLVEIVPPGSDGDTVIKMITPNISLPDNSLYQLHPGSDVPYLIETDPRFTIKKQWLGSDYMQNQLTTDADNVLKRLGDGFYEQQLIRQQVVALTGNRYLGGYSSDEAQFQALMDAGVTFGKDYNLTLGVALTAQQMALLTSDMVWLVKQTITLPDGTPQDVLVPQLYARVKSGDLDGSGALLAGNNISLNLSNDLTNSGQINGREVTQLTADSLNNSGFIGGDKVSLQARTDINNIGGTLQGGSSLTAIAGRDINSISTLGGSQGNITFDRPAGIYVQNDNGTLGLQAMNNINLTATQISNSGEDSQTKIIAGSDLNLNTLTTTSSEKGRWGKGNDRTLTQSTDIGSQITGNSDVLLSAGHDMNARAATVSASNALTVVAGNDITLTSGETSYHLTENSYQTSSGMLSKKSVTTHDEVQSKRSLSSTFDGDSVTIQAGHNLSLSGSNVAGTNNVALAAGNNLIISTAEETRLENHLRKETKSGLSGTGGIGVSIGTNSLKTTDDGKTLSSTGSTVGSTQGNVNLTAGNSLTVKGSDVLAGKDLNLTGREVNILAAENQSSQTHTVEQKQSGLTLVLSGTVGSAINSAVSAANEASNESNDRLAALKGVKAALTGVQAYQGTQLAETTGSENSMIGVNLSYGSQSSKSTQTATQTQSQGSTLTAGNNLTINATRTDIHVQGSQLQAGKDMGLSAARDVSLSSGLNSQTLEGKNESHGASVGVGINFGQGANGLSLNASVNKGKGSETGNGVTHTETTVNAGNNLTLSSGRDTTLTGAQVNGEKVTLDVGRNLTLTSEQDSDNYDSKQQNASAGGSVSMSGGSGSVNLSRDKMHSTFETVQEQTGIFAGAGGFDVTVGEHTQLNGAVIGSTAAADKNKLDTGTLGFSDIHNSAEYEVEHQSAGISSGGSVGGQFVGNLANGLLTGVNGSGSDSSTTKSAVSEGTITVRDQDNQKQNVDELSRDVEHANQTLSPIFDKEKEQRRLKEAQLIGEIGSQAADIARTQGQIIATRDANEKMKSVSPEQLKTAEAEWRKANPGKEPTTDDISGQAYQNFYNKTFNESGFGTGGKVQQTIQAATAAVQGLACGDLAKAIAGGSAPYIASVIGSSGLDDAGNVLAHAAVNAALAAAQGNSALVGAAGASTAELTGMIALNAYGKPVSELSETEKQTVSALATLAAGLAGGLTGNGTADVVAAAQAGKTTVENNSLSDGWNNILPPGAIDYGQSVQSYAQYAQDKNLPPEQVQADLARMVKGDLPESANIIKAILENNPGSDTVMAVLSAEDAKDYALALLTSIPAEKALSLVGKAAKVIDNKILISAAEKISTAKPGKQSAIPRDLNEQIVWKQVQENPAAGEKLLGMNNDPRFPASAGFQKMQVVQKNAKGESITIHYQYNSTTGKAYDMKVDTPQRVNSNPADVIENIKGQVK